MRKTLCFLPKTIPFIFISSFLNIQNKKNIFSKTSTHLNNDKIIPSYFEEIDPKYYEKKYPKLTIIQSRSVDTLMGKLRDLNVNREQFRFLSARINRFIIEEALASECDTLITKQSPLGYYISFDNPRPVSNYIAVSILRSGNAMVDEMLKILPDIAVGNILVQRDESTENKIPIFFFDKLPKNINDKKIFLLDPMLASGGSSRACIEILLKNGAKEENIIFLNLISCPEGIEEVYNKFPKIKIITAKVDKWLLPNKYIAPGVGDFGDRYFGTDN